ncbi:polysialyltransferase family glycosyltransferase [Mangrovibacterium marinum]|uniref:capsular polysaccharide export protein, LipB/KpsS family n=1 Tax=Mangrovibacterium marinum TaxID=1639118 RepID=UPI002A18B95D|nr:hypothetical protein [Mangrovibacterium marinum]
MRIAIAPFASTFVDFFINIAEYLRLQGNEVYFINPDRYINHLLCKNGFQTLTYPPASGSTPYYNEKSSLIRYCSRLYGISPNKLIEQKNKLYNQANDFFGKTKFDRVLIWNGENNAETDVCKQLNIPCFFFENGYFPNTLQTNLNGVNCHANYAQMSLGSFMRYKFPTAQLPNIPMQIKSIKQSTLYRYLFRIMDPSFSYMAINIIKSNYRRAKAERKFKQAQPDKLDIDAIGKFIFFPLQVNSDTQIILNSPYASMYEVLELILPKLLKTGYKIIIKEHPFETEPVDYSKFIDNKKTFLLKKFPIEQLIDKAEFTINVNSSVGLQVIARNGTIFTLGNCLYHHAPRAVAINKETSEIKLSEIPKANTADSENYIKHLQEDLFITGSWRNPTKESIHAICCRILADLQSASGPENQ